MVRRRPYSLYTTDLGERIVGDSYLVINCGPIEVTP